MANHNFTDLLDWKGWGIVSVLVSIFATIAALLGWEVKQIPEINFGNPVDRANEPHLAWWQIPLSIKKTKWYQHDRLIRCRVSVRIIGDVFPCVWTTINGPIDVMDLIEGDESQYVPIIARSTIDNYVISGDPRFRPYIPLRKAKATLTDLTALINGTGIKEIGPGEYQFQLRIQVPGKISKNFPSHDYHLEVPSDTSLNREFILR